MHMLSIKACAVGPRRIEFILRVVMRVLFVCSGGGHLMQLYRLRAWWEAHDRHWVTFEQPDAVSLLDGEKVTWAYHPTTRNIPNLIRNLWLALRLLPRYRPDVIINTGTVVTISYIQLSR